MKFSDTTEIISIKMKNFTDGSEEILFERLNRKCYFKKEFTFSKYIIQLRLHWEDIRNEPTLDADIWRIPKSKKTRLRNGPWHHIPKEYDQTYNHTVYKFKFNDLELILSTTKTFGIKIQEDAIIVKDNIQNNQK